MSKLEINQIDFEEVKFTYHKMLGSNGVDWSIYVEKIFFNMYVGSAADGV